MDILLAFAASLIPAWLVYMFLVRQDRDKPGYREDCKRAFLYGLLTTLPVAGAAIPLYMIGNLAGLSESNIFFQQFYKDVILAALLEEIFKLVFSRKVIKKSVTEYSSLDITAYMILVALGFEVLESVVYLMESGPIHVIVRGVTMMHGVFGFIMGRFYSRGVRTGKKIWYVLALLVPWIYHGLYDFTLSQELSGYSDLFIYTPVTLALLSFILVFVMVGFFLKAKKKEEYTASLRQLGNGQFIGGQNADEASESVRA